MTDEHTTISSGFSVEDFNNMQRTVKPSHVVSKRDRDAMYRQAVSMLKLAARQCGFEIEKIIKKPLY